MACGTLWVAFHMGETAAGFYVASCTSHGRKRRVVRVYRRNGLGGAAVQPGVDYTLRRKRQAACNCQRVARMRSLELRASGCVQMKLFQKQEQDKQRAMDMLQGSFDMQLAVLRNLQAKRADGRGVHATVYSTTRHSIACDAAVSRELCTKGERRHRAGRGLPRPFTHEMWHCTYPRELHWFSSERVRPQ